MNPKNMLKVASSGEQVKQPTFEYFDTPPLMAIVEMKAKGYRDFMNDPEIKDLPQPPYMWKENQSIDFYLGYFSAMRSLIMGATIMLNHPLATPQSFINEMQNISGQLANIIEKLNKPKIIITEP